MTSLGLDTKKQAHSAQLLNTLLANEFILYTKTLKFHWNIQGKHFGALHLLFNNQYEQLLAVVDRIAERVRALEALALGTVHEFQALAEVKEEPAINPDDQGMIKQLLSDHELIIRLIRDYSAQVAQIKDEGTVNMLGDIIETHEKIAWILRAHIE